MAFIYPKRARIVQYTPPYLIWLAVKNSGPALLPDPIYLVILLYIDNGY